MNRTALPLAVVAWFALAAWSASERPAPAEPAPCVCDDVDARVAGELAIQSAAMVDTSIALEQSRVALDAMVAGCMWLPPRTNLGVRRVARLK